MASMRSARCLVAIVIVASLALAIEAAATSPGANGILAWSNGTAIYGVDPGSTTERVIVDVPGGGDDAPSWSADGEQIAFEHDSDPAPGFQPSIWKADADGTGATPITLGPADRHPSWSPDGQRLVFAGPGTGDRDIFVVDADGSNRTQLTFTPGREQVPSWSPDGSMIAYERNAGSGEEIWTMSPDGTDQTFLAPGEDPDWSPFGDELVIRARYPDTGQIRRISSGGTQTYSLGVLGLEPTFSPDGARIAYTGLFCCPEHADIFSVGFAGGERQGIAEPTLRTSAAWQPIPTSIPTTYVRPKHASPVRVPLVPAFRQCESPDHQHGPPLAFGSCSSPQQTSTTTTVGTPDANGAPANSEGFVRFRAVTGNPANPPDEADIAVQALMTDVRLAHNGADYAFSLEILMLINLTDRDTPGRPVTLTSPEPGTGLGFYAWPLRVPMPCEPNSDPLIGSDCQVSTTLDAVLPGVVPEGRRAVWGLDQVRVNDSGEDVDVSTPYDNELFATQGLFVP
jgi:hypothetical protein